MGQEIRQKRNRSDRGGRSTSKKMVRTECASQVGLVVSSGGDCGDQRRSRPDQKIACYVEEQGRRQDAEEPNSVTTVEGVG